MEALAIVMQVAIVKLPSMKQENSSGKDWGMEIIFSDFLVQKNNQAYGKKWIYNPNTKETLFVKLSDIDKYFHLGFIFGNGRHKK